MLYLRIALLAFASVVLFPGLLWADGGYYEYHPPSISSQHDELVNEMVDQRALMKVDNSEISLLLQNVHRSNRSAFAWVVPVPHPPSVECMDERILDGIDYETAPLYRENHWQCAWEEGSKNNGLFGCGETSMSPPPGEDGDQDLVSWSDVSTGVTKWANVDTGCLDYQIISSLSGDAVLEWLEERGYEYPEDTAKIFSYYGSRGWVFLVSEMKGEEGVERTGSNQTVHIRWPRCTGDPVVYPMALTGSTANRELSFRLYLVSKTDYLPTNYPVRLMPDNIASGLSLYEEAFEQTVSSGEMVIEYHGDLQRRHSDDGDPGTTHFLEELWSKSTYMKDLDDGKWKITRYSARFPEDRMGEDMFFHAVDYIPQVDHLYERNLPCVAGPTSQVNVASVASKDGFPLGAILPLFLVLAVRMRKRSAPGFLAGILVLLMIPGCSDDSERDPDESLNTAEDRCDGIDNDGDGMTDELWPSLGESCSAIINGCQAFGAWTCASDQMGLECLAHSPSPSSESCNGVDDDCDGVCDNGFSCCLGYSFPCENNCGHVGLALCASACELAECQAAPPGTFEKISIFETIEPNLFFEVELDGVPPAEIGTINDIGQSVEFWADAPHLAEPLNVELEPEGLSIHGYWSADLTGDLRDEVIVNYHLGMERDRLVAYSISQLGAQEILRVKRYDDEDGPGQNVDLAQNVRWRVVFDAGAAQADGFVAGMVEDGSGDMVVLPMVDGQIASFTIAETQFSPDITPEYDTSFTAGDYDGDGAMDLVLLGHDPSGLDNGYFFNGGSLLGGVPPIPLPQRENHVAYPVLSGDFDRDGEDEIMLKTKSSYDSKVIFVEIPSGQESGDLGLDKVPGGDEVALAKILSSDLDGDGYEEIGFVFHVPSPNDKSYLSVQILTDPEDVQTRFFQGTWKEAAGTPFDYPPYTIRAMDLDAKGGQDLVASNYNDSVSAALSPGGCE